MLPLAVVEEIRRHLNEGRLSQRKIAAKLGISRGTVGAIASGRRGVYGRESDHSDPLLPDMELLAERCSSCGGMVHKPCVLCQARTYRRRQKRLAELQSAEKYGQRRVA